MPKNKWLRNGLERGSIKSKKLKWQLSMLTNRENLKLILSKKVIKNNLLPSRKLCSLQRFMLRVRTVSSMRIYCKSRRVTKTSVIRKTKKRKMKTLLKRVAKTST